MMLGRHVALRTESGKLDCEAMQGLIMPHVASATSECRTVDPFHGPGLEAFPSSPPLEEQVPSCTIFASTCHMDQFPQGTP